MSFDKHGNFAYTTVATGPAVPLSSTSLTVANGTGSLFPVPPFNVTIWPSNVLSLSANAEICRVTAISGDVFTISRGQEGTTIQPIVAGYQIAESITSKTLTDVENAIPTTTDALPQGVTNLYFADQAARNSLSGGSVVFSTYSIGAVSGAVVIDFTKAQYQTVSLSGNVTFSSTNRLAGRNTSLKVFALSTFNMAFNQNWIWLTINYSTGSNLTSASNAILTLTPFGANESDVIAVLAFQG